MKNNVSRETKKRKERNTKTLDELKGKYNYDSKSNTKVVVPPEAKKLSHKQILFCEEYIKCQNATKSYLASHPNVKESTAKTEGCKLLNKSNIKAYIEERLKPKEEEEERKAIADANEILEFITAVVRGEVKDQLGFETSVKDRLTASKMLADRYRLFDKPTENENGEEEKNAKVIIEVVNNSNLEKVLYENKE